MGVDVVDRDHHRVAAPPVTLRCGSPVLGITVGDDHHAVAEGNPGAMPACPPRLGEAEGLTQPVNGLCDVGIDEFRGNAGWRGTIEVASVRI